MPRRARKFSKQKCLSSLIEGSKSLAQAARDQGCHPQTAYAARKSDPEFSRAVDEVLRERRTIGAPATPTTPQEEEPGETRWDVFIGRFRETKGDYEDAMLTAGIEPLELDRATDPLYTEHYRESFAEQLQNEKLRVRYAVKSQITVGSQAAGAPLSLRQALLNLEKSDLARDMERELRDITLSDAEELKEFHDLRALGFAKENRRGSSGPN